jgi:DNA (cytosine-5)-methyltransferase 1
MRILNLYAGIGGNRALWGNDHEITAVEQCPHIAGIYRERFPMDRLLVEDAHQYLLNHFTKFDFIWSSPPCQSHGQCRFNLGVKLKGYAPLYPDMTLYQEILLLRHHFAGRWIVENTVPYYEPLIAPTAKLGRHLVWSNFAIPPVELKPSRIRDKSKIEDFDGHEDVSASKIPNKRQALRT